MDMMICRGDISMYHTRTSSTAGPKVTAPAPSEVRPAKFEQLGRAAPKNVENRSERFKSHFFLVKSPSVLAAEAAAGPEFRFRGKRTAPSGRPDQRGVGWYIT